MKALDVLLRRTTTAAFLTVALVVGPLPVARLAAQVDAPRTPEEEAAKQWAEAMIVKLQIHYQKNDVVALQPLDPDKFTLLDADQRRQIYEWLFSAFKDRVLSFYDVVHVAGAPEYAKILKNAGEASAHKEKEYVEFLEKRRVRINIICTRSEGHAAYVKLSCSAYDFGKREKEGWGTSTGGAPVSFKLEWLNRPITLRSAVNEFAEAVVQRMKGLKLKETRVVDGGIETHLSREVTKMLEDAIGKRIRTYSGPRSAEAAYQVEGEIGREIKTGKTYPYLRVILKVGERRIHMGRKYVADLGGMPEDRNPAKVFLPGGMSLLDWVSVARKRLKKREYAQLLTEAKRHIRDYGSFRDVVKVQEQAITGLLDSVRLDTRADAPQALQQLGRIRKLAGERPALLRLMARAHRFLGDYKSEEDVLQSWLRAAPQDHSEREEVVDALVRVQEMLAQHKKFAELVGRPFSSDAAEGGVGWTDLHYAAVLDLPGVIAALVDRGMAVDTRLKEGSLPFGDDLKRKLAALGHEEWKADGETPLHVAILNGSLETAEFLIGQGAVIESPGDLAEVGGPRELVELIDDAAYSRAKELNTAVAYLEYLSSRPHGRHRREAMERLGPGVYLTVDVAAGERIDGRHLHAAAAERIASGDVRDHAMVRGGCYARARPAGSRLEWADVAARCSR